MVFIKKLNRFIQNIAFLTYSPAQHVVYYSGGCILTNLPCSIKFLCFVENRLNIAF